MRLDRLLGDVEVIDLRGDSTLEVTAVSYDSRAVRPGALFCCVRGERVDGHIHARAAVSAGAVALLCERVLPIDVPGASPADLSLALPGFEEEAITRAVAYDVGQGRSVRLCTAEDLVVYKCVAGRPQDVMDVESIVARQGDSLDVAHIRRWVEEFAQITEDREIVARFERAWASRPNG